MIRKPSRRSAFSLIEIMCVMVLIFLIGTFSAILFRQTLEVERIQAAGFNKVLQSTALADQFRADVAGARAAPAQWQDIKASPRVLILQRADGSLLVYSWDDDKLRRSATEKSIKVEQHLPLDAQRVGVEFASAEKDGKVIRLLLHTLREGQIAQGQSLEIAAALGGDWR